MTQSTRRATCCTVLPRMLRPRVSPCRVVAAIGVVASTSRRLISTNIAAACSRPITTTALIAPCAATACEVPLYTLVSRRAVSSTPGKTARDEMRELTALFRALSEARTPSARTAVMSEPHFRQYMPLLQFVMDPSTKFGITRAALANLDPVEPRTGAGYPSVAHFLQIVQDINKVGGKGSMGEMQAVIRAFLATGVHGDEEAREVMMRLLDRNLRVGCGPAFFKNWAWTDAEREELATRFGLRHYATASGTSPPATADTAETAEASQAAPASALAMTVRSTTTPAAASPPAAAPVPSTPTNHLARLEPFPAVVLGYPYKGKLQNPTSTFLVSRKLDGVRMIAHVLGGSAVECYSRTGKALNVPDSVRTDLMALVPQGKARILDGELCAIDPESYSESFDAVIGAVRSLKRGAAATEGVNVQYCVFDMLTEDEFRAGRDTGRSLAKRFDDLFTIAGRDTTEWHVPDLLDVGNDAPKSLVRLAPHILALTQAPMLGADAPTALAAAAAASSRRGWEGVMVRRDTQFKGGRSSDLVKIKRWQDKEYAVMGVDVDPAFTPAPGTAPVGLPAGPVAYARALLIQNGSVQVAVGTGMSLEQRLAWGKDPSLVVGKTITVQYFEETKDGSLRFPSLKAVYDGERDM
ncbi:hypothetical protein AMAG_07629 [Allomyces macrogynus ATCC 38327]|uniref:ATP-dependent DNA ligase family profile domain-containing protein n=1 Tax=Allomyces macrogynus (strain ATCC 38327) TaxID=578462 RepID=A0A0L0SIV1_ALLM3|nr:hypothetical protein AMAG_07629 [Allomyces macrogynus ATCC 38327]|eukprot:KNE62407.1 hypothetical protein AMAG_07629 [Allomyces macrogynus ATCC 38327]